MNLFACRLVEEKSQSHVKKLASVSQGYNFIVHWTSQFLLMNLDLFGQRLLAKFAQYYLLFISVVLGCIFRAE